MRAGTRAGVRTLRAALADAAQIVDHVLLGHAESKVLTARRESAPPLSAGRVAPHLDGQRARLLVAVNVNFQRHCVVVHFAGGHAGVAQLLQRVGRVRYQLAQEHLQPRRASAASLPK